MTALGKVLSYLAKRMAELTSQSPPKSKSDVTINPRAKDVKSFHDMSLTLATSYSIAS